MNDINLEQVVDVFTNMMNYTSGVYNTMPFSEQTFMLLVQDFV